MIQILLSGIAFASCIWSAFSLVCHLFCEYPDGQITVIGKENKKVQEMGTVLAHVGQRACPSWARCLPQLGRTRSGKVPKNINPNRSSGLAWILYF